MNKTENSMIFELVQLYGKLSDYTFLSNWKKTKDFIFCLSYPLSSNEKGNPHNSKNIVADLSGYWMTSEMLIQ